MTLSILIPLIIFLSCTALSSFMGMLRYGRRNETKENIINKNIPPKPNKEEPMFGKYARLSEKEIFSRGGGRRGPGGHGNGYRRR